MMNYFKIPLTSDYSLQGIASRRPDKSMIANNLPVPAKALVLLFCISPKESNEIKWIDVTYSETLNQYVEEIQIGKLHFAIIVDDEKKTINTYMSPDNFLFTEWITKLASSFVNMCESNLLNLDVEISGEEFREELFQSVIHDNKEKCSKVNACIMYTEQGISAEQQAKLMKDLESQDLMN